MSSKRTRVPEKHIAVIQQLSIRLGPSPRHTLAVNLMRSIDVSLETALDYIRSCLNENILEKVGMNYQVRK